MKQLNSPYEIRKYDDMQLHNLSDELSQKILEYVSRNGGYLSDNLSAIDLSLTLYKVFDENDRIYFSNSIDYTYKLLNNLDFDYEEDHIFAKAIGNAINRDLNKQDYQIILVINNDDLIHGNNLELLNQLCNLDTKVIIILNDNSDSDKVTLFNRLLNNARSTDSYQKIKENIKNTITPIKYGDYIIEKLQSAKENLKKTIIDEGIFSTYNIDYIGPVSGHNYKELYNAFSLAKSKKCSTVIHCLTMKGKGYRFAENDNSNYYRKVDKFNISTGKLLNQEDEYSLNGLNIINKKILESLDNNINICVLSNDIHNDYLTDVFAKYPHNSIKTNLTESNKLALACSIALNNQYTYLTLNSKDITKDLDNTDCPLLISVKDNNDLSFINYLKNTDIFVASSNNQIKEIYDHFIETKKQTIIININQLFDLDDNKQNNLGFWNYQVNNDMKDVLIFAYGKDLLAIKDIIEKNELNYSLIDSSLINKADIKLLNKLAKEYKKIYFYGDLFDYLDLIDSKNINRLNNDSLNLLFDKIRRE